MEKIIRYSVYGIACQYEELYSRIKGVSVGTIDFPDGELERKTYKIPDEERYRMSITDSEFEKIKADCEAACNQLNENLDKRPISYI